MFWAILMLHRPTSSVISSKLFQLMLMCSYIPSTFKYIVPIPKTTECNKTLTCDDFRGIAISPHYIQGI